MNGRLHFCRVVLVAILLVAVGPVFGVSAIDAGDSTLNELYETYDTARSFCDGLSDEIAHISKISKANTAVSGVGTVASGVAFGTGIAKFYADKNVEDISKEICEIGGCNPDNIDAMSDEEFVKNVLPLVLEAVALEQIKNKKIKHDDELKKSKRLGKWRSGTMAISVGTNVATAILAGLNRNQSDLVQHVMACNTALDKLKITYRKALDMGEDPIENQTMLRVNRTINNCGILNTDDIEKIEKRMSAVMGVGIAGATIGAVGTGTSIAANTDKIRLDNSDAGKQKEKALNTVANVAAGTNVAIGAVETGLNISLIGTAKRLIQTATMCEGTL